MASQKWQYRLIFPGWLPCGEIWQWDFVKPTVRAWENPAGGLHSELASRGKRRFAGNKLQVDIFPDYSFHGFGDLPVQPSLKPRYGRPIWHTNQCCCLCYRNKRCAGKSRCCLTQRQVLLYLFYHFVPGFLILSARFFCLFILCIVISVCIWSGYVLPLLFGHVLLPLVRFSGHVLLGLCGNILCWLGF